MSGAEAPYALNGSTRVSISGSFTADLKVASDWYIGRRRAMISLGPIGRRHCTYRCAFCYVQGDFPSYPSYDASVLLAWLKGRLEEFDTVYVSGDTDSFAPPRTYQGLALLEALLVLKKDVLFTTRAVLSADARNRMSSIASEYQQAGLRLIACISISQLSHPELEPPPIPSPGKRIEQMSYLKKLGLVTALTIRPFIPGIDPSEYASIASLGARAADVIIGGDLYSDFKGIVRDRIESAGLSMAGEADSIGPLYFSTNESHWFTHKHPAAEGAVAAAAAHAGVPFFMGSEPAIDFIRSQ